MEATVIPLVPLSANKTYALYLMVPTSYPSATASPLQFFFARFTIIASSSESLDDVDTILPFPRVLTIVLSGVRFPSTQCPSSPLDALAPPCLVLMCPLVVASACASFRSAS
jgi:hypothetical protein